MNKTVFSLAISIILILGFVILPNVNAALPPSEGMQSKSFGKSTTPFQTLPPPSHMDQAQPKPTPAPVKTTSSFSFSNFWSKLKASATPTKPTAVTPPKTTSSGSSVSSGIATAAKGSVVVQTVSKIISSVSSGSKSSSSSGKK